MSNPEISEPARSAALEFSHIIATMEGERLAQRAIDLVTANRHSSVSTLAVKAAESFRLSMNKQYRFPRGGRTHLNLEKCIQAQVELATTDLRRELAEARELVAQFSGAADFVRRECFQDDASPEKPSLRMPPGSLLEITEGEQLMMLPLASAIEGKTSIGVPTIQRALGVGYTAAAQALELLEKIGWVGPADERGRREVIIRKEKASEA